jgi:hypothetical protein
VQTNTLRRVRDSIAGSLPDLPGITWEDFERASALASFDVTRDIDGTPGEVDTHRLGLV